MSKKTPVKKKTIKKNRSSKKTTKVVNDKSINKSTHKPKNQSVFDDYVFAIEEVALENDIMNANQLAERTGLTFPRAKRLWKGIGAITLQDIATLCFVLSCTPADLIQNSATKDSQNMKKLNVVLISRDKALARKLKSNIKKHKLEVIETAIDKESNDILNSAHKIAIHIQDALDWLDMEFLKTAYPSIPRFAIIKDEAESDSEMLIKKYRLTAVFKESNVIALPTLITSTTFNKNQHSEKNESFLNTLGKTAEEVHRIEKELFEFGLRTLPQPLVADDTTMRLRTVLEQLKSTTIKP